MQLDAEIKIMAGFFDSLNHAVIFFGRNDQAVSKLCNRLLVNGVDANNRPAKDFMK